MAFELNDEKAIDILIWWIEGSDGSIDYSEEEAVRKVLEDIDYSMETFYQETLEHIGALATEDINKLVDEAVQWGSKNFDHHKKQVTLGLLSVIAESTGEISSGQQEKLETIKEQFGIEDPAGYDSPLD